MNQKVTANQIFFTLLGVVVVVASVFVLVRAFSSQGPVAVNPTITLPTQNPYSFSSSSPLAIVQTTSQVAHMGTLVTWSGTLPAVGSCQSVSVQTPTYAKDPVRFAFIINTAPNTSCPNPQAPQTFTASFGTDSKGNTPALSAVFVNGSKVIYTVNGN